MEETNKNKLSFIKRVYRSIIDFDAYSKFSEEPLSKAIKYLAILVFIYSLIIGVAYAGKFGNEVAKGAKYLDENIEDISFEDGILSFNNGETTTFEEGLIPVIIVDTSDEPNLDEYREKAKLYNYGLIILKNKMLVVTANADEVESAEYSQMGIESMSKTDILSLFNNAKVFFTIGVAIFIVEFIQYFVYVLFFAIVLAIVAEIIALILRIKISFKSGYIMGIYALTLPTILEALYIILNLTTGLVMQYFSWMYTTISYIYVCVAILMIKTDFLNLKKQMMKIKEEESIKENKEIIIDEPEKEEKETKDKNENEDDKNLKEQTDG